MRRLIVGEIEMTHRIKARNIGQVLLRGDFAAEYSLSLPVVGVTASDTQFDAGISKAIGTDPLVCLALRPLC